MNKITITIILILGALFNANYSLSCSSSMSSECSSSEPSSAPSFHVFSTIVEPEMELATKIQNFIGQSTSEIKIAVDQFTNLNLAQSLVNLSNREYPISIKVITGDNEGSKQKNPKNYQKLSEKIKGSKVIVERKLTEGSCKMHNKFIIIDDSSIMTGSPNLTIAANNNSECSVTIQNDRELANIYNMFFNSILEGPNPALDDLLTSYNDNYQDRINICLAPTLSVRDFIKENINDAQNILINMFLISRAKETGSKNDIIAALEEASDRNTSIEIRVDGLSYDSKKFMRDALIYLKEKENVKISKVYLKKKKLFHDKLLLVTKNNTDEIVILGSAGFTDHVQDNKNYENMIAIKNNTEIFYYFHDHFDAIKSDNSKIFKVQKLDEPSPFLKKKNKRKSARRNSSRPLKEKEGSPGGSKDKEKNETPQNDI